MRDVVLHRPVDDALATVGSMARFAGRFFVSVARPPYHLRAWAQQAYAVGVRTLPLTLLTGTITGIVFTQQSRPSLEAFGATSWLPSLITLALFRSLAPLVTALICAGRVGSSIGAELGSMKVSEQLEAMEVSAINPFHYLVVPRVLATTTMVPLLTTWFAGVGFLGAFLNVTSQEGTSWAAFVQNAFGSLVWLDLGAALARSVLFGFTVGLLACYHGFHAGRGGAGVGIAANKAVVQSMLLIFIEEILFVQLLTLIRMFT
jgi:phospholipid/cholesterol/gamma-HCH transport system permease protein